MPREKDCERHERGMGGGQTGVRGEMGDEDKGNMHALFVGKGGSRCTMESGAPGLSW